MQLYANIFPTEEEKKKNENNLNNNLNNNNSSSNTTTNIQKNETPNTNTPASITPTDQNNQNNTTIPNIQNSDIINININVNYILKNNNLEINFSSLEENSEIKNLVNNINEKYKRKRKNQINEIPPDFVFDMVKIKTIDNIEKTKKIINFIIK
jgi:hypothetical protein